MFNPLDYFFVRPPLSRDAIGEGLWNAAPETTDPDSETILRQYVLCVEMADRVSQRRSHANTFFLTINAGVLVILAGRFDEGFDLSVPIVVIAGLAMIAQCFVWFWILRSYRQLNSAKFAVIGALEQRLPARPYSDAEWIAVGEGLDPRRYWPLSKVEALVPFVFVVAYAAAILAIALD